MGLERQYKVCNFGLKAEICWSLKRREGVHWSLKQTYQLLECVLRPPHYFTKRVLATEERYVGTLSDCVPTTHNRHSRRIKVEIIFLYIYEFFVVCPAVQYTTRGHRQISFHNTEIFPFNLVTASTGASCAENLWLTARSRFSILQCSGRSLWRILPLCRDAVGVFYRLSRLSQTWQELFLSGVLVSEVF